MPEQQSYTNIAAISSVAISKLVTHSSVIASSPQANALANDEVPRHVRAISCYAKDQDCFIRLRRIRNDWLLYSYH